MTRVLIVGANGFLGRTLAKKCIAKGWHVDVVVNSSNHHLPEGVENVFTSAALEEASAVYNYVFNTAANIPYGKYNEVTEQLVASNIELPLSIHRLFPEAKVIFASSISVYGNNHGLLNEASEIINPTAYGLSKLSGEMITAAHRNYAIVRFSSLYGSGMYSGTFIPYIINDAKSKGAINLLGEGLRKQNYIHISDAAEYCIHAALHGINDIYLGVYTKSYQNREVAEIISSLTGCAVNYTGVDNSPSYEYDNIKTLERLKFTPGIPLEEGLNQMIDG